MTFLHEYIEFDELKVLSEDGKRYYVTPQGMKYPSVTTVLSHGMDQSWKDEWIARVGEEEVRRVSKQATRRGTAVHEILEGFLNNDPQATRGHMPANIYAAKKLFRPLQENVTKIFRQEAPLYSDFLRTAGRVDCVGEWNNRTAILDFKTSKRFKEKSYIEGYFMQCSFYAYAFYERTGMPVPEIVVLITVDEGEEQVFVEKTRDWLPMFMRLRDGVDL